jgi:hypothetical protein
MNLKKALDVVNLYSRMILKNRAQSLEDMDESEIEELQDAVDKTEEFLNEFK